MKFEVPEEIYGKPELAKELLKQILTKEQYIQMFKAVIKIDFKNCELLTLSDWVKNSQPNLEPLELRGLVSIIFMNLEEEGIITAAEGGSNRRSFVDNRYGKRKGRSLYFNSWGYNQIKKEILTNMNSPKEYNNLTNLCKLREINRLSDVRKIYGILESQGFIEMKSRNRKPTKKGKPYMKSYKNSKGQLSCLFKVDKFKELLDEIGWYTTADSAYEIGFTISDLCKMCGHVVDKHKAHCDKIVKGVNLDLKVDGYIEKPDGKRWRFTEAGLEEGLGYNEIKGKTIQARFYKTEKILKLIKTLIEEEDNEN